MAGNRYIWRYAKNVHEQYNPNAEKRNHWSDLSKAVSYNGTDKPKGSGSASFTDTITATKVKGNEVKSNPTGVKSGVKHTYNFPYTVTAHQYDLNLPKNAYIYKITFKVCMKADFTVNAKVPKASARIYGSAWHAHKDDKKAGGWYNGSYYMQPNVKLSSSWKEVEYVISEKVINEGGFTPELLNDAIMGIDLIFNECGNTNGEVYIKWASVGVEYDVPDHKISFDIATSKDKPYYCKTGYDFKVKAIHTDKTKATDVARSFTVKKPSFGYDIRTNPSVTNSWTVPAKTSTKSVRDELTFTVKPHILGLNSIEVGGAKFWMYSTFGKGDDYANVTITPNVLRKAVNGCIQVNSHVWDEDGIVTYTVTYAEGYPNTPMKFTFNPQLSSANVSVRSIGEDSISFSIPPRTECDVCFDVCTVPVNDGTFTFRLVDDDGDVYRQQYNVLPPYSYQFCNRAGEDGDIMYLQLNPVVANAIFNRFATSIGDRMVELSCSFNEESMYITDCDLTASRFEELDYVGCVPLMQTHFDPKSDYTDTLLNETYKNKTYMGKKGVIDETITLNLRVPPRDVTTLQGLVEMDKPVPINTCHTAFEGDALNHRGWVELYGVKDVEKTNPNFYKIALDVKYLTHNISHKFDILRHSKITDAEMPSLFAEKLSFDDPLSDGLNVVDDDGELVESSDFFEVDTDGMYQYISHEISGIDDEDTTVPETETYEVYDPDFSNFFCLDEGQHVRLTSHETLSPNVKISCNWKSNKQGDNHQNNSVKRVFRIRDALNKDNILFDYTYYDFEFEDDGAVKARVNSNYTTQEDNIRTLFSSEIEVRANDEYDEGEDDNDDEFLGSFYGSTVVFELKGNKLTVTDEGHNGRELYGSCELKTGSYIFECEFTNLYTQTYDEVDGMLYLDMEVLDTYLRTDYDDMYSNLVVSPYPVVGKKILFTRHSEEGTIYYLYDDNEPFKYLLEPYYQYHCGVDLKTREGISLFNLNNSYNLFYMQNGLVRIGFNRVDGEVSLAKYDPKSGEYITTNYFKLNANVKFEKGILNDDKIEILADTMVFTMWRGHPYVLVNHPNNDIEMKSIFTKVFGETGADGLPSLINLMNEDNLLPSCVGGTSISPSCVTTTVNRENLVEEHTVECTVVSVTPPSSESQPSPTPISPATWDDIDLGCTAEFGYLFDEEDNPTVASLIQYVVDGVPIDGNTYTFDTEGVHDIYAVYLGDDLNHYAVSDTHNVKIEAPETFAPYTPTEPGEVDQTDTPEAPTGKFTLTCDTKSGTHFTYNDGKQIKFTLRRGGVPIKGKVVEIAHPDGLVASGHTDANGQRILTNKYKVKPSKNPYYVSASFYNNKGVAPYELYKKSIKIYIDKQKCVVSQVNPQEGGTLIAGQSAKFQLKRKDTGTAIKGSPLLVSYNGGFVKQYQTDDNGQIRVKLTKAGTYKFTVHFVGSDYKTEHILKTTIKVNKKSSSSSTNNNNQSSGGIIHG